MEKNKYKTKLSYVSGSTPGNVKGAPKSDKQTTACLVFLSLNPYFFQYCLELFPLYSSQNFKTHMQPSIIFRILLNHYL